MSFTYPYPRPSVTVDAVVFGLRDDAVRVLLIKRDRPPFEGQWALPGGFVDMDEPLEEAAIRELREETSVRVGAMLQVGAFGGVDRDPRGRVISIAYVTVVHQGAHHAVASDDARALGWFDVDSPPSLAFDHAEVLERARDLILAQTGGAHFDASALGALIRPP